jgi:hypothetical protein
MTLFETLLLDQMHRQHVLLQKIVNAVERQNEMLKESVDATVQQYINTLKDKNQEHG